VGVDPVTVAQRVIGGGDTAHWSCSGDDVEALARVVLAASEVIESVPATYDEAHPTVKRHAAGLIALEAALRGE
jgi:hypothetical protein